MKWAGIVVFVLAVVVTPAFADEGNGKAIEDDAVPAPAPRVEVIPHPKKAAPPAPAQAPAPSAAPANGPGRCVPVWETVTVPCTEQRCAPVWRDVEVPVYESRQVPCTRACCDPCTGVTRTVACGSRTEWVQTGTRTERVFCGYRTECVTTSRQVQQFRGWRRQSGDALAGKPAAPCNCDFEPVTVVPDGTDKSTVVLLAHETLGPSKRPLWESEFEAEMRAADRDTCGGCIPPAAPAPTPAPR